MMRRLFLLTFCLLISQLLTAQVLFPGEQELTATDTIEILNNLDIEQDPRLAKMLSWHIENNKNRNGIEGFRVEIFFSSAMNALERAQQQKVKFLSKYPEKNVHIQFAAPNFKVRVGDFRTKNEALKLQKQIQRDYPSAFIVPDIITFPLLKQENYERPN
ncbi:MAG TPA: SPOR domain-containing protein [Prolixibacteraceae bacterium]|nr:SPOR domain-containing protein [Prolixibacteraceae bacterium]